MRPTMNGAMIPPSCPRELISAMPAAAAMPVRKRGGMVQKIGIQAMMPVMIMVMPIMSGTSCPGNSAQTR